MSHQKIFAIGDIHGCASELSELLAKLPLDKDSLVIFLGDYVDRGPRSKDVIDIILKLKEQHQVIALMGNHEAMMVEFFKDPSSTMAGFFVLNGGSATLASYVTEGNDYHIPDSHLQFVKNLPLFYETESHIFVHAGLPDVKISKIDPKKHGNEMMWIRGKFHNSKFKWKKTVVHGHTPSAQVVVTDKRINLDTGCVFNNMLSAMEINSGQLFQVKARESIPHTFLKENPDYSNRVAKRFEGVIPVFVERQDGSLEQYQTLNYNEFGLLILQVDGEKRILEVGQILKGRIGPMSETQIQFTGQVVRHQIKGNQISYGIKMLEPLSKKSPVE